MNVGLSLWCLCFVSLLVFARTALISVNSQKSLRLSNYLVDNPTEPVKNHDVWISASRRLLQTYNSAQCPVDSIVSSYVSTVANTQFPCGDFECIGMLISSGSWLVNSDTQVPFLNVPGTAGVIGWYGLGNIFNYAYGYPNPDPFQPGNYNIVVRQFVNGRSLTYFK